MKLGIVRYRSEEELGKSIGRFFPEKIRNAFIRKLHPYAYQKTTLLGAEGYEITINLGEKSAQVPNPKIGRMLEELLEDFYTRGVSIVIPPEEGSFPSHLIRLADGRVIHSFFVAEAIRLALASQEKPLQEARIVLIDGGNSLTRLTLEMLYPHVNFLSVYTDRKEGFSEIAEDIYADCGLSIQLFSDLKHDALSGADVILNCSQDHEPIDYVIKKKSVYFDLAQNRPKLRRLIHRREDMLLFDGLLFSVGEEEAYGHSVEAAYYVHDLALRRFLCGRYDPVSAHAAAESLASYGIIPIGFSCLGKPIKAS